MRYVLSNAAQGTPEWREARAGKATGSRAGDIIAKIKSGEAAARRDYRTQLVIERLTGAPAEDGYVSKEMQWGIDQEPFARMAYEAQTGRVVREAGFAYLPDMEAGCSVDGFLDDDDDGFGVLEGKCPKSATHLAYIRANRLPPEYVPQATHNVWVTGAAFVDFTSYDPRFPENLNLQLFVVRVYRSELPIAEHEAEVRRFLAEVDSEESLLRKRAA